MQPFSASLVHSAEIVYFLFFQVMAVLEGSVCLIRKERSVPVKVQRMRQIPTGRPLTPSNIWPLHCVIATITCPSQERGHVNLLDY